MNYDEIGKRVKEKYPQYADIPDEELGRTIINKYPQYSDVGKDTVREKPREQITTLQKIGGGVAKALPPVLGIAGGLAGAAGGLPVGGLGAIPASAVGTALGTAAGVAGRETLEDFLGLQKDKPFEQLGKLGKEGAAAGVTDLAVGGLFSLAGKAIKPLTDKLARSLVKQGAIKLTRGAAKSELKAGKDLVEEILEKGISGTPEKVIAQSDEAVKSLYIRLDPILSKAKGVITLDKAKDVIAKANVDEVLEFTVNRLSLMDDPGIVSRAKDISALRNKLSSASSLSIKEGNLLRQVLDGYASVAKSFGKEVGDVGAQKTALRRSLSDFLRSKVKDAIGPEGSKIFDELSYFIRLGDAAEERVLAQRVSTSSITGGVQNILQNFLGTRIPTAAGQAISKIPSAISSPLTRSPIRLGAQELLKQFMSGGRQ